MKALSMVAAIAAAVTFVISIVLRLMSADLVAGTSSVTFWRVTVVLLLFSIALHLHGRKAD
jgi:hypothetical protein